MRMTTSRAEPAPHHEESLRDLISSPDYPCLGARSVFNRDRATVQSFARLAGPGVAQELYAGLIRFAAETDPLEGFASFVATFRDPVISSELEFEQLLWRQLQELHQADGRPWSGQVSHDPGDPHFAFSVGGTAFFIVGLHPQASRLARRAAYPTLVFNLHEQFEVLRALGGYPRMRDTIRRRDQALQGSVNPMVADHGEASEARQYSGRVVPRDWSPPLVVQDTVEDVGRNR